MTTIKVLSMYDRIGGQETVDRLVESFYGRMDSLAEARIVRELHGADLEPTKAVLKLYLGEWLGGPALDLRRRPRLQARPPAGQELRRQHRRGDGSLCHRQTWPYTDPAQ